MKIAIANDHAGYEIKLILKEWLEGQGYDINNYGTDSPEPVDYPDFVHPLAASVEKGEFDLGILICGSGQGATSTRGSAPPFAGDQKLPCWRGRITMPIFSVCPGVLLRMRRPLRS